MIIMHNQRLHVMSTPVDIEEGKVKAGDCHGLVSIAGSELKQHADVVAQSNIDLTKAIGTGPLMGTMFIPPTILRTDPADLVCKAADAFDCATI
jgi:hypothetical protein